MFAMRSVTSLGPRLIIPVTRLLLLLHFHFAPPRHEVRKATGKCRFGNCIVYERRSDRCTATRSHMDAQGRVFQGVSSSLPSSILRDASVHLFESGGRATARHQTPRTRDVAELYQCYSFISVLINKLLNYRNFL